ncbi:MAG TPA: DPP IV N-terminal domain-containing protein, partial [Victivallales bacterium]|nr:DPP IV N-terminal domain-containing protein [Victivallales bacterium]
MNPPGVYKINLEGGVGRFDSLERLNPEGYFLMPMINPDASSVLFWGRQEGEKGFNIWRNDLNGKDPVKLTDHRAVSGHPFWNSDASRVVFFSTLGVSPETDWNMADQFKLKRSPRNIWIMGRNGENPIRLTEGPYVDERPCISPDGRTVVFVSDRSGYMNLWSVSTETGELRQITKHQKRDYRPIFSPKGDCLAFFSTNNSKGMDDLCLMK